MSVIGRPLLINAFGGTKSGDIVNFGSSLKVGIEPVQDLHGYDSPWPAGGGKNKYPVLVGADTASRFNGGSATNDNGTLVVDVNTTLYSGCYLNSDSEAYKLALKMSGQCTVSYYAKADKILNVFIGYQAHGNSKKSLTTSWQRFIDTAIFDETGYTFNVYNANTDESPVAGTVYIKDFMFETGGTASDYAPYSNICPISGWSAVNVWRTGKNLFDTSEIPQIVNGMAITVNNNGISYSGTAQYNGYGPLVSFKLPKAGQYHFHLDGDGHWLRGYTNLGKDVTVDVTDTSQIYRLSLPSFTAGNQYSGTISNVQIELGSTATPYEPYSGAVYLITFPAAAGTVYGGTLTVNGDGSGTLVVDRACTELNESWYWYIGDSQPTGLTVCSTTSFPDHIGQNGEEHCSHYSVASRPYIVNMHFGSFLLVPTGKSAYFCFKNESGGTAQEFKDYIVAQRTAGTPIQVEYTLATPVTYTMTPEEVGTILLQVGRNNIWADTGPVTFKFFN